ncbi:MAG: fucose isomerase [Lentisphaerae bacterium RIFOXYB12_FULL_65_16]|nr:MAG: fucose isomerase [Lentisphaerae bacterium RIFOXYA12_64_32]OGV93445.1 MAG: fucose isomerase [Lentisphaerae bacterium RIFOXYB12_FULL_65_16]
MLNTPTVKLGIVGVSRNCFPAALTGKRLGVLMKCLAGLGVRAQRCSVIIETEDHAVAALAELAQKGCNAAVVYLGNFGPEGPTTLFAQRFPGPVMACAAAEEDKQVLAADRGDALCGMLNVGYNLNLRRLRVYVPQAPVGLPAALAPKIAAFQDIARVVIGVKNLKIFGFGPRPQDFLACNAPVQPLYDLGVEVMENSELDLLQLFRKAAENKARVRRVAGEMAKELGPSCAYPDLLPKLAQLEVALTDFAEANLGACKYAAFGDKCWPAFEFEFGFAPCYVNSRMAGKGIPVACEVDLYGAMSEYMIQCASQEPATLLDINNSVPDDVLPPRADLKGATKEDLFMGFHCGNTCSSCMKTCSLKFQLIMNRLMENGQAPDISRGTLEGQIKPGPTTMFRLQGTPDCKLRAYIGEGEILDIDPCSFGAIGIVAVPNFLRFYRHVLIAKGFPHHGGFGFKKVGKTLFEAVKLLGVEDIGVPLPKSLPYPGENPFELFG